MLLSQRFFRFCHDPHRKSISDLLTAYLRAWLEFGWGLAVSVISRALLTLPVLVLFLNWSACAQSKARPADFKVNLLLLPSELKGKSNSEMQSFLQRATSGNLGLVQGPQLVVPLISVTEYKRDSEKINLTAECLAIGPDGKTILDNRECGSATEANLKPPDRVLFVVRQAFDLRETSLPGIYVFRVVITDHVNGTSATAEQRFTYAPSGAAQTASSAAAPPAPGGAAQAAPPGSTTPGTGTLDGLYAGHFKQNNIRANWYLFKPSGAVAIDCNQALFDPNEVLSWPTQMNQHRSSINFVPQDDKSRLERQGYQFFECALGRYRLSGDKIQIVAQSVFIDLAHRIKIRDNLYDYDDKKGEAQSFRFVDGPKQIEIGQRFGEQSLVRQVDQSGKKLSGNFGCSDIDAVATHGGKATFLSDGQFSMEEEASVEHGSSAGSSSARKGRYEIRGNEIIFHNSDGTTSKQLFGDLGKDDHGRERVAIGGSIWTKGLQGIWGT